MKQIINKQITQAMMMKKKMIHTAMNYDIIIHGNFVN